MTGFEDAYQAALKEGKVTKRGFWIFTIYGEDWCMFKQYKVNRMVKTLEEINP